MRIRRTVRALSGPSIPLALAGLAVWQWSALSGALTDAESLQPLLGVLSIFIAAFGVLLGLRLGSAGIAFASLALALVAVGAARGEGAGLSGPDALPVEIVRLLLPLDLALFSLLIRRRIWGAVGLASLVLVAIEVLACTPVVSALDSGRAHLVELAKGLSDQVPVPALPAVLVAGAGFLWKTEAVRAGFLAATVAAVVGGACEPGSPGATIWLTAAGLALVTGVVEAALVWAFVDELTGLAGRRTLERALAHLGGRYAIAMIDVDHFKRFNDRHGHRTGDQVLGKIAGGLRRMKGGARVFRYGGEEFAAVFPGLDASEALPHLEEVRKALAADPFVVRARRRKGPKSRGKAKAGKGRKVRVTVSMGVAGPGKNATNPHEVLRAADRALFRAKRAGRNRVAKG